MSGWAVNSLGKASQCTRTHGRARARTHTLAHSHSFFGRFPFSICRLGPCVELSVSPCFYFSPTSVCGFFLLLTKNTHSASVLLILTRPCLWKTRQTSKHTPASVFCLSSERQRLFGAAAFIPSGWGDRRLSVGCLFFVI